jgi:hypothetical protein
MSAAAEPAFTPTPGETVEAADFVPEPALPEPVRQRVIALAAGQLTGLPVDELPAAG